MRYFLDLAYWGAVVAGLAGEVRMGMQQRSIGGSYFAASYCGGFESSRETILFESEWGGLMKVGVGGERGGGVGGGRLRAAWNGYIQFNFIHRDASSPPHPENGQDQYHFPDLLARPPPQFAQKQPSACPSPQQTPQTYLRAPSAPEASQQRGGDAGGVCEGWGSSSEGEGQKDAE